MSDLNSDDDDAALEKGRLLFSRKWDFLLGVPSIRHLPPEGPVEVAFAGRSNVGKSSLINALVNQNGLARTSNTPGRTQELNYFIPASGDDVPELAIVDMPGYGFAKAPKSRVLSWTGMVFDFLQGRSTLRRVFVLVDVRHGLKPNDLEVLSLMDKAAVSYQIVLTKADKVKPPALQKVLSRVHEEIKKRPAAHPEILVTSAEKKSGIEELRAAIAILVDSD